MSDFHDLRFSEPGRRLALGWLWLGVYSLIAAGVLAVLLALSRTPAIQELMPGSNFFRVALVVHVDLSVLIWFMACSGLLWSLYGVRHASVWSKTAFVMAVTGTFIISISPFLGATQPLMNNYIPVILQPWFFYGLIVVTSGLALLAIGYLLYNPPRLRQPTAQDSARFALWLAALCTLLAIGCVILSWLWTPNELSGQYYFDLLFWGGGHVQQVVNTLLVLLCWTMLAAACGNQLRMSPVLANSLFALSALPVAWLPWLYSYPIDSSQHLVGFTNFMRIGGLASLPLGLIIFFSTFRYAELSAEQRPLRSALISSLTLFVAGGVLGFYIRGSNTIIPAHYHGSIVAVTMAFMGLVFMLLPRLGRPLKHLRAAYWMPWLYGGGQLMHITALAFSGGYGVQRKTAGAAQGLDKLPELLGMAAMGLGGMIAVAGGLMFLWIVIATLRNRPEPSVS